MIDDGMDVPWARVESRWGVMPPSGSGGPHRAASHVFSRRGTPSGLVWLNRAGTP